ncbi:hypothetical protein FRC06_004909 [Ceratobasidium sp. 370]|nr:hypothetical protein FRC06_004909 [Ceratobasidium sp. 370]
MTQQQKTEWSEKSLREQHTIQECTPENRKSIETLVSGLTRPPKILEEGEGEGTSQEIAEIVDAVAAELGRQYTACAYVCAVWRNQPESLAVTEAWSMPDPDPTMDWDNSATLHHFTHYALARGGRGLGIPPAEAHPVCWPDFDMSARPALPPAHPNWEQEHRNLLEWFTLLWRWQGGDDGPDWEKIVDDIEERRFVYMDETRMPESYRPFRHPLDWDEATTRVWSKHIRSTMDEWGRVLRSKAETAVQFRMVDDIPNDEGPIICEHFVDSIHPKSQLEWATPALLFEKRVKRAMTTPNPVGEERARLLYDEALGLVTEVDESVPGVLTLREMLRTYEANLPPEGEPISSEEAKSAWHPAAARVVRSPESFRDNWDRAKLVYPEAFASRISEGHHGWAATALRDWLRKNPFWDTEAGALKGGFGGVVIAFYALIQFAINIKRVAPNTQEEENALIDKDLEVYGRADFRTLSTCVGIIREQIERCARMEPRQLQALETDSEDRHSAWKPEHWVQYHEDGSMDRLPTSWRCRPSYNVFDANIDDWTGEEKEAASGSRQGDANTLRGMDVDGSRDDTTTNVGDSHLADNQRGNSMSQENAVPPSAAESAITPDMVQIQDTVIVDLEGVPDTFCMSGGRSPAREQPTASPHTQRGMAAASGAPASRVEPIREAGVADQSGVTPAESQGTIRESTTAALGTAAPIGAQEESTNDRDNLPSVKPKPRMRVSAVASNVPGAAPSKTQPTATKADLLNFAMTHPTVEGSAVDHGDSEASSRLGQSGAIRSTGKVAGAETGTSSGGRVGGGKKRSRAKGSADSTAAGAPKKAK